MSLTILIPDAMQASRVDHMRSQSVNPDEWNAWIGLGTAITAGAIWLWRHSLGGFCKWLWNFIKAPQRIEELYRKLLRIDSAANLALAMSRVTWRTIDRPIWQSDASGLCVHCNPFLLRLLARQEEDIIGNGWMSTVHEEDRARVEREWERIVLHKRDFHLHYRWITSTGVSIPILAQATRLLDLDGVVLGWVGFVTVLEQ